MQLLFVGIGLSLVLASGVLSAIGHYDGVLGAPEPEDVAYSANSGVSTFRVRITGGPEQAANRLDQLRDRFLMPDSMKQQMLGQRYVPVEFAGDENFEVNAYLRVIDRAPERGQIVVATAAVHAYWPINPASPHSLNVVPVLLLETQSYREPILFKA